MKKKICSCKFLGPGRIRIRASKILTPDPNFKFGSVAWRRDQINLKNTMKVVFKHISTDTALKECVPVIGKKYFAI